MKRFVVLLLTCMLGLAAQVNGDIVLQKAKEGGHALGIRLGMTREELSSIYSWFDSGFYPQSITAFVDLKGVICAIEVRKEIVKSISLQFYSDNQKKVADVVHDIVPAGAWKNNICSGVLNGVSYDMITPYVLLISLK